MDGVVTSESSQLTDEGTNRTSGFRTSEKSTNGFTYRQILTSSKFYERGTFYTVSEV